MEEELETIETLIVSSDDGSIEQFTDSILSLTQQITDGNKYQTKNILGVGGMGKVLSSKDKNISREVAMKVLKNQEDKNALIRFIDEARITGQLEHPNIIPVHELGIDEQDSFYYTMKKIKGVSLEEVIKGLINKDPEMIKKYPLTRLINVFTKVCDALSFAHSRNVVHRDIKPDNIMVGDFGEVLLLDWGLAKVITSSGEMGTVVLSEDHIASLRNLDDENITVTMEGQVMGSPLFMSPEQATGNIGLISSVSDVYSMGAVLYRLLSLNSYVRAANLTALLRKVCLGEHIPVESWNPDGSLDEKLKKKRRDLVHTPGGRIPAGLAAVTRKAMSVQPKDRYSSIDEMKKEIENWQGGYATAAEKATFITQFRLLVKRNKGIVLTAAVFVVLLTVLGSVAVSKVLREKNIATKELKQRKELETKEQERVKKIALEAGQQLARADKLMENPTADNLIEAQRSLAKAVFLQPSNELAHKRMVEASVKHFESAVNQLAWEQAEEKLYQAKTYGLPEDEFSKNLAFLEESRNKRRKTIEERITFLVKDAGIRNRQVPEFAATREIIAMKDPHTVKVICDLLAAADINGQRMLLSSLAWMGEGNTILKDEVIEKVFPYIMEKINSASIPIETRESAAIVICRWGGADKELYTRLNKVLRRPQSSELSNRLKILYLTPFAKRVNAVIEEGDDIQTIVNQSVLAIQAEDWDRVIRLSTEILKKSPGHVPTRINRAKSYVNKRMFREGEEDYRACLKYLGENKKKESSAIYGSLGELALKTKKPSEAIKLFNKAEELDSKNFIALYNRANTYNMIKKPQQAVNDFQKVLKINPGMAEAVYGIGLSFSSIGKFKEAAHFFTQALAVKPELHQAYSLRAVALINMKKFPEAVKDLTQCINRNYRPIESYQRRSEIQLIMKKFNPALADVNQAIHLKSNNMRFFMIRAQIYIELKEFSKALEDLNHIISNNQTRLGNNPKENVRKALQAEITEVKKAISKVKSLLKQKY